MFIIVVHFVQMLYTCTIISVQVLLCLMCIVNPRRACVARVTVLGLSVCVSVCPALYSRISPSYAANKRYERLQRHMGSKNKKVFCFVRKLERYLLTVGSAILSRTLRIPCIPLGIPYKSLT